MNETLRKRYDSLMSTKSLLLINRAKVRTSVKERKREINAHIEARQVITRVTNYVQYKTASNIERLVTFAIRSVFDRPFSFHLKFKENRNTSECFPVIKEGKDEFFPKDELGGGIIDIIAFAIRIILWSIQLPRSRAIMLLDEPFRFCGSLVIKAAGMAKRLSRELSIQMLIITHDEDIINIADRAWLVNHNGIKSKIMRRIKRRWKNGMHKNIS